MAQQIYTLGLKVAPVPLLQTHEVKCGSQCRVLDWVLLSGSRSLEVVKKMALLRKQENSSSSHGARRQGWADRKSQRGGWEGGKKEEGMRVDEGRGICKEGKRHCNRREPKETPEEKPKMTKACEREWYDTAREESRKRAKGVRKRNDLKIGKTHEKSLASISQVTTKQTVHKSEWTENGMEQRYAHEKDYNSTDNKKTTVPMWSNELQIPGSIEGEEERGGNAEIFKK